VKTIEEYGIGVHSLARRILGVEGRAGALGWGLRRVTSNQLFTRTYTNQTTSWIVCNLSIFSAQTSHGQTQTHKTHHDSDLKEVTTFPLVVYFMPGHGANAQMSFCPKIPKIGIPVTLEAHNFVFKPLIKVRFKEKL